MGMDVNLKKLKKNAFRYSKVRGETASRVRIPGGVIGAKSMLRITEIAEKYGNGTIFITNRQGVEIPGIKIEDMDAVNKELQLIIDESGVNQEVHEGGYPASGTRNVVACPGKSLCPFGCYDTTEFARKMDKLIFPNNLHMKVAFTGCSNDCGKVRMDDFGIIGMTEPQYDPDRCVGCEQCVKYCKIRSTGALQLVNGKVVRDPRSKEHYFRVVIMGRTGKKNPRLAEDFIRWADEESILKIVKNCYAYVEEYIDKNALEGKEHVGYIVDRTGYEEFLKYVMEGVQLPEKAEVASRIYWGGKHYDRVNELK